MNGIPDFAKTDMIRTLEDQVAQMLQSQAPLPEVQDVIDQIVQLDTNNETAKLFYAHVSGRQTCH
tara:strand:+ start:62486 stop:62680 length:195 start_codon:yes stop_codon:yes gene_type:complete